MQRQIFLLLLPVSIFLVSCGRKHSDEEEESSAANAVVPVQVSVVSRGNVAVSLTVTGRTDVLKKERILAPVAGKIASLKVLEFQEVHAGDVLAVIRTKESQAAIDGAVALQKSATNPTQKSEAKRMLELAAGLQSSAVVRATINGIVSSRSVTEGELVAENTELLTIINPATIYFVADLPLRDVKQVRRGQSCIVRFPTIRNFELAGIVDALSPQSDLQSQTVRLRIRFARLNSGVRAVLRADMMGTVTIVTGIHRNALLVPKAALIRNDEMNSYSVIAVSADSLAKIIAVHVGEMNDSTVEVISNQLREGMTIVTEGNYALPDSTKVTIVHGKE